MVSPHQNQMATAANTANFQSPMMDGDQDNPTFKQYLARTNFNELKLNFS